VKKGESKGQKKKGGGGGKKKRKEEDEEDTNISSFLKGGGGQTPKMKTLLDSTSVKEKKMGAGAQSSILSRKRGHV